MDGEGSQQRYELVCGKVPYRLSGAFRPVRRFPFPCLPGTVEPLKRRYNHNGFELPRAGIEALQRKRKKEGLNLKLGSTRVGGTDFTSTRQASSSTTR